MRRIVTVVLVTMLMAMSAQGYTPCKINVYTGESECPQPVVLSPQYLGQNGTVTNGSVDGGVVTAYQSYSGKVRMRFKTYNSYVSGVFNGVVTEQSKVDLAGVIEATIKLRTFQGRTAVNLITRYDSIHFGIADAKNQKPMEALWLDPRVSPFKMLPVRFPTPELGGAILWFSDLQYAFSGGSWQGSSECNAATLNFASATALWLGASGAAALAVAAAAGSPGNPTLIVAATTATGLALKAYAEWQQALAARDAACGRP